MKMLRPVINLFLEKLVYLDKTMRKQRNIYKKLFKPEAIQFISVTIEKTEYSKTTTKLCKIGEKNETFPNSKLIFN